LIAANPLNRQRYNEQHSPQRKAPGSHAFDEFICDHDDRELLHHEVISELDPGGVDFAGGRAPVGDGSADSGPT